MTSPTPVPLDPEYVAAIGKGLDGAFARASVEPFDPADGRIVVFSDHHKGVGDPADDFRRCEHAYTAALGYYLEEGYRLFVLGDAEELWEEHPGPIIEHYSAVLDLEAEFVRRGNGLERFFGNHDDQWAYPGEVARHLRPVFGPIKVREALRLSVNERDGRPGGTLFLVHGHQGTAESDRWGWASRLFVRYVWRPLQRRTGYSATTPAGSYVLRAKHDRALYEWARAQRPGVVLIAGHTHRPVFARSVPDPPPTRPIADLERALADAHAAGDAAAAAAVHAELEFARTSARRPEEVLTVAPPCYFNTGCCSFPDGDITGIEIAGGEMRLVRWPGDIREICSNGQGVDAARRVLASEQLDTILEQVARPAGAGSAIEERAVRPA